MAAVKAANGAEEVHWRSRRGASAKMKRTYWPEYESPSRCKHAIWHASEEEAEWNDRKASTAAAAHDFATCTYEKMNCASSAGCIRTDSRHNGTKLYTREQSANSTERVNQAG